VISPPAGTGCGAVRFDDLDLLGGEAVELVHYRIDKQVDLFDPQQEQRKLLHRGGVLPPEVLSEGPAVGIAGELSLVILEDR
jgi:hypothetical protein